MKKRLIFCFAAFFLLGLFSEVQAEPSIDYDPDTETIKVKGPGTKVNLTIIDNALQNKAILERLGPFEWLLKANLMLFEGVTLELYGEPLGGDVNWLKLSSDAQSYAALEASNGNIIIKNTKITSWDVQKESFDKEFLDGSNRAFIAVKNRSSQHLNRMDVINSEIAYLGFFEETAYGISWKVISNPVKGDTGILGRGITGIIKDSKFHDNYFGVYVWGAGDVEVRNNEIYNNYKYGFDAHTYTQRTVLENNFSHDNGWHGIIFADRSTQNIVQNNVSAYNEGHGIMLHEFSNDNKIINNEITGNQDGLPVFESSNNLIASNTIQNNAVGVRVYGRENYSRENLFENNEISKNSRFGIYVYDLAEKNTFQQNRILANGDSDINAESALNNVFTGNVVGNSAGSSKKYVWLISFLTAAFILGAIIAIRRKNSLIIN